MRDTLISTIDFRQRAGGRSKMWIHRHQRSDPGFPTPYRFAAGGPKFWRESEVDRYLESCREPRPNYDDEAA